MVDETMLAITTLWSSGYPGAGSRAASRRSIARLSLLIRRTVAARPAPKRSSKPFHELPPQTSPLEVVGNGDCEFRLVIFVRQRVARFRDDGGALLSPA
jgi:hypothetical protein